MLELAHVTAQDRQGKMLDTDVIVYIQLIIGSPGTLVNDSIHSLLVPFDYFLCPLRLDMFFYIF